MSEDTYEQATRSVERRTQREQDDEESDHEYIGDIKDDLTEQHYKDATLVLIGRGVDLVPDSEDLFYDSMMLAVMLGVMK